MKRRTFLTMGLVSAMAIFSPVSLSNSNTRNLKVYRVENEIGTTIIFDTYNNTKVNRYVSVARNKKLLTLDTKLSLNDEDYKALLLKYKGDDLVNEFSITQKDGSLNFIKG